MPPETAARTAEAALLQKAPLRAAREGQALSDTVRALSLYTLARNYPIGLLLAH